MTQLREYKSMVSDSTRWAGFVHRPGDIVISTPPKAGTTWTQMLCAMLVFRSTTLPARLAELSPWLDMLTRSTDDVFASLEAQEHRRFIKTHTPLDGLPMRDDVTYICVGRDPRDIGQSWEHHLANMDMEAFMAARERATGDNGLSHLLEYVPMAEDPTERFWQWAESDDDNLPTVLLVRIFGHLQTCWDHRNDPNVHLFHYADLLADLPAELRRLADALGIDVSDEELATYAEAGSFGAMKRRADELVPNADANLWKSNDGFFHRGASGQWRDVIDDEGIRRYEARVAELVDPDLARWAHEGRSALASAAPA